MSKDLQRLVSLTLEYFEGRDLPKTVTEYIKDFAPGCSRQMIKKYTGMTCGDFLAYIGADYQSPKKAIESLIYHCDKLDFYPLIADTSIFKAKDRIVVKCKICGYEHNTTLNSLRGSKLGCRKCKSGNLPWASRKEELEKLILVELDGTLVGDIPNNQLGYISIQCNKCALIYTTQLVGVTSPNSELRATCPNCRDSDRRVVVNGIVFGSKFEYDCYKLIKSLNPELHVSYSKYLNTSRRWVCDFKIGNNWIEVSNFKTDYKGYFSNIEEKRDLVENSGHNFFFLRSIEEVELYINSFKKI